MPTLEYVVRKQDGLWEVWLNHSLLSGQPTYVQALSLAHTLATAATQRGEPSRVVIATIDGVAIEAPLSHASAPPASRRGIEKAPLRTGP